MSLLDDKPEFSRLERHAGLLIAVPLVAAILILLNFVYIEIKRDESAAFPTTLLVDLEIQQPEPVLEPPSPVPPILSQVAATRVGSQETGEMIVDPVPGEKDSAAQMMFEAAVPPPAPSIVDWIPNTKQATEIQTIRDKVIDQSQTLEERQKNIKENIIRMEVVSAAKDFELNSDGGTEGAIRLLKLDNYEPEQIRPLLDRYGISFERRYTKPVAGRGYLNAASTEAGTFRNVEKEGFYDVLVLSTRAVGYLATLETSALGERGYNPASTRVRKIIFGVVMNTRGEYDLGVTELQVEQIR